MLFQTEPSFQHASPLGTAVVLCNLGTPDAPTPAAVRRYLAEFLSDKRVVEIPSAVWKPILHGVILRTRPAKSAAKYASIWTPEGSPLLRWTQAQAQGLQALLAARGHHLQVVHAMRYGNPSVPSVLNTLKAQGVTRIVLLPAYPQYSATTTASLWDSVYQWGRAIRHLPELRFVNHYHDDAGYIAALAERVRAHWQVHGQAGKLLMSFHGVPRRTLELGDPYHCECHKTARLLAEALGLSQEQWQLTFQSRFGKAQWLQPYTEPMLRKLAKEGVARVDVVCPGFSSDCLETLEEIAIEGKQAFLSEGGKEFHYIPCLNDGPTWLQALTDIAERHLAGWPTREAPNPQNQAARNARAKALGAT